MRNFRIRLGLALTLKQLAEHSELPLEFLHGLGLHDLEDGGVGIPYRDGAGRAASDQMSHAPAGEERLVLAAGPTRAGLWRGAPG